MSWQEVDNSLQKEWTFDDFSSAWGFASRVALVFEQHQHHGEMMVTWGKVRITTTTHDAGNTVTDKDRKLADAIDGLA